MNVIKSNELSKSNRCSLNRQKNLSLNQDRTVHFEKSVFIINQIKLLMDKKRKGLELTDEVKDYVKEELIKKFYQMGYATEKTAKLHAVDAYRQIMRYVLSETRYPAFPRRQTVELNGLNVTVGPDMVFFYGDTIEVVKIKCSKPIVKLKSSIKDEGVNTSLELYAFLQYAKLFCKIGRKYHLKASYYYLRKNSDRSDGTFDNDFFDTTSGGNIVSLEDEFIGGGNMHKIRFASYNSEISVVSVF